MKSINAVLAIGLFSATFCFAGPTQIITEKSPPPAPTDYFKANEWDFGISGVGSWMQTTSTTDRYFGTDKAFGGTIDAKYFFTKNIGAGIVASGYDVQNTLGPNFGDTHRFVGDAMVNVTYRYPIGQLAPYVFENLGVVFNGGNHSLTEPSGTPGKIIRFELAEHDAKMLSETGVGAEYRFTPMLGAFTEAAFDKIDRPHSNFFSVRAGFRVNF